MALIPCPRILIAGTSSGVGKSFISLGIVVALIQRGISVSVCLHGVRLPQAILYRRITLRQPYILDPQLLTDAQILRAVRSAGVGADIVVIDGNLGLFDGRDPTTWEGSDARIAELLGAPVALVFDGGIFDASSGALVKGFSHGAKGQFSIEGAIANWLDSAAFPNRDRQFFEKTLTSFDAPQLLGAIPIFPQATAEENALPGVSVEQDKNRTVIGHSFILEASKWIAKSVDVDALVEIARRAAPLSVADEDERNPPKRRCRIAVSDDSCFHLGFPNNLDLLRFYGAELLSFSPLADSRLPDRIGGVYLTGAYLSEYGAELAGNSDMRAALKAFVARGGLVYAEGGGAAFLCEEFIGSGGEGPLAGIGVLKGRARSVKAEVDYIALEAVCPSFLGEQGTVVRGVDSSEWLFEGWSEAPTAVMKEVSSGRRRSAEVLALGNRVVATTAFLHWGSAHEIASRFVEEAEQAMR
jgi:cobyrinic acid a,c-diamide synthase